MVPDEIITVEELIFNAKILNQNILNYLFAYSPLILKSAKHTL